ncbi:MAG: biotin/lipoyl-containing protein [Candidatus Brocadiia bacterium]
MELLRMPRASENMVEGTVGNWLVMENSPVEASTPLVEIITEKAQFELECTSKGTVRAILAPTRSTVPVNFVLAVLASENEELDIVAVERENASIVRNYIESGSGVPSAAAQTAGAQRQESNASRIQATPRARKMAKDAGVQLETIRDVLHLSGIIEEEHVRKYLGAKA